MSTFKSKIGAGLMALALGSAMVVGGAAVSTPAQAHGHGFGGGFRHHSGWGWDRGYGWGYAGGYYGGCYLKRFITYDGEVVFRKVCY